MVKESDIEKRLKTALMSFKESTMSTLSFIAYDPGKHTLKINHAYDGLTESLKNINSNSSLSLDVNLVPVIVKDMEVIILNVKDKDFSEQMRKYLVEEFNEASREIHGLAQVFKLDERVDKLYKEIQKILNQPVRDRKDMEEQVAGPIKPFLDQMPLLEVLLKKLVNEQSDFISRIADTSDFTLVLKLGLMYEYIGQGLKDDKNIYLQNGINYLAELLLKSFNNMLKIAQFPVLMQNISTVTAQLPGKLKVALTEIMPGEWTDSLKYQERVKVNDCMLAKISGANFQGVIVKQINMDDSPGAQIQSLIRQINDEKLSRAALIPFLKTKSNVVIKEFLQLLDKEDRTVILSALKSSGGGQVKIIKRNR